MFKRLTYEIAEQIRDLRKKGMGVYEIAAKFEITATSVSRIVLGKAWTREDPFRSKTREERFQDLLGPKDERGCIPFIGVRNGSGYGVFGTWNGEKTITRLAHRVAWELANGQIPEKALILHKCDNPPCTNVEHLFLGSHQDNSDDMCTKLRGRGGTDGGRAKLTENEVREMRSAYAQGSSLRGLARRYGLSEAATRAVLNRATYKHII